MSTRESAIYHNLTCCSPNNNKQMLFIFDRIHAPLSRYRIRNNFVFLIYLRKLSTGLIPVVKHLFIIVFICYLFILFSLVNCYFFTYLFSLSFIFSHNDDLYII